ncbi:MAG: hypothetical protein H6713_34985 [Myxococcales bacterium]|nr:hypothetical protein [Myxococcales bacterium]MCB9755173.1 hypothetical protein [Myxococcales bacterium]
MTDRTPRIRAGLVQAVLSAARSQACGPAALARLDPSTLTQVESSGSREWLPASVYADAVEAIYVAGGHEALDACIREASAGIHAGPVGRAIWRGFTALFTIKPETMLAAFPRALRRLMRGVGRLRVDIEDDEPRATTRWSGVPTVLQRESVALAHRSGYTYALGFAGVHEVELTHDLSRAHEGVFTFEIRWRPRS